MRIAVTGAHRTGKTTLALAIRSRLPRYEALEEPYYLLEEDGYEFPEMPSLEDFEAQLERSIECVSENAEDRIFDRCPADLIAYLIAHPDADGFDATPWIPRVQSAMQRLDLIVYVPIESPDRIGERSDRLRERVDDELRSILEEDRWGFGVDVLTVEGTPEERVRQVLAYVKRSPE